MALGARGIRIYKVSSIEYQCRVEECVVEAAARLFLPEWTDRCMMYLWQLCPVLGRRKCERIRRDVHTVTAQTLLTSWAWLMAFIENIGQGRVVSGHQDHQGTTTTNWDELGSSGAPSQCFTTARFIPLPLPLHVSTGRSTIAQLQVVRFLICLHLTFDYKTGSLEIHTNIHCIVISVRIIFLHICLWDCQSISNIFPGDYDGAKFG